MCDLARAGCRCRPCTITAGDNLRSFGDRRRHVGGLGFDQIRIGRECAVDVVKRREQGLGDVGGLAGNQRHTAAAEAVIEQATRCAFASDDVEAGNVIADLEGGRDGAAGAYVVTAQNAISPDGDFTALAVACQSVRKLSAALAFEPACGDGEPVRAIVGIGQDQGGRVPGRDDADGCGIEARKPGKRVICVIRCQCRRSGIAMVPGRFAQRRRSAR
jgi:hypothetical protein